MYNYKIISYVAFHSLHLFHNKDLNKENFLS